MLQAMALFVCFSLKKKEICKIGLEKQVQEVRVFSSTAMQTLSILEGEHGSQEEKPARIVNRLCKVERL